MSELYGFDLLIEDFLNKKISANEFDEKYTEKFLRDNDPISEELFLSLDWLFAEVDCFTNDKELTPDFYVSEDQLRISAAKTLAEIKDLQSKNRTVE